MVYTRFEPKNAPEGFYHNWQMPYANPTKPSLENKTNYKINQPTTGNGNQDYSEGSGSKYSEGHPDIPGYFLG